MNKKVSDHEEAFKTINDCLMTIGKRLNALEEVTQQLYQNQENMPTPDKVYYKPDGYQDYLNIKENYDQIYSRIAKLEEQAHPKPTGATQKRVDDRLDGIEKVLEEKLNGM